MLALQLEQLYAAEAKRRSQANLKRGENSPDRQKSDSREVARTDEQLAALAGTSRDTIRKVKVMHPIGSSHLRSPFFRRRFYAVTVFYPPTLLGQKCT